MPYKQTALRALASIALAWSVFAAAAKTFEQNQADFGKALTQKIPALRQNPGNAALRAEIRQVITDLRATKSEEVRGEQNRQRLLKHADTLEAALDEIAAPAQPAAAQPAQQPTQAMPAPSPEARIAGALPMPEQRPRGGVTERGIAREPGSRMGGALPTPEQAPTGGITERGVAREPGSRTQELDNAYEVLRARVGREGTPALSAALAREYMQPGMDKAQIIALTNAGLDNVRPLNQVRADDAINGLRKLGANGIADGLAGLVRNAVPAAPPVPPAPAMGGAAPQGAAYQDLHDRISKARMASLLQALEADYAQPGINQAGIVTATGAALDNLRPLNQIRLDELIAALRKLGANRIAQDLENRRNAQIPAAPPIPPAPAMDGGAPAGGQAGAKRRAAPAQQPAPGAKPATLLPGGPGPEQLTPAERQAEIAWIEAQADPAVQVQYGGRLRRLRQIEAGGARAPIPAAGAYAEPVGWRQGPETLNAAQVAEQIAFARAQLARPDLLAADKMPIELRLRALEKRQKALAPVPMAPPIPAGVAQFQPGAANPAAMAAAQAAKRRAAMGLEEEEGEGMAGGPEGAAEPAPELHGPAIAKLREEIAKYEALPNTPQVNQQLDFLRARLRQLGG